MSSLLQFEVQNMLNRKDGFAFVDVPEPLHSELVEFYDSIPDEWKVDNHGKKFKTKPKQEFHSTFLLSLDGKKEEHILSYLRSVMEKEDPFSVKIGSVSVDSVDRIKTQKVVCAVFLLESNRLGDLKAQCSENVGKKQRYAGAGHISLIYVLEQYKEQLKERVQQLSDKFVGREYTVDHIVYKSPKGVNTAIPFRVYLPDHRGLRFSLKALIPS